MPSAIRDAENKPKQLRLAHSLQLPVLDTLVTQDTGEAREFLKRHKAIVVKPLYHGELGEGLVAHTTMIDSWSDDYDVDLSTTPHLFQRFVQKSADYRVTIVDNRVYACRLDSASHVEYSIDVRRGLPDAALRHDLIKLDVTLEQRLVTLVNTLGLRFGAIDLVEDRDRNFWFLEINPNGQWAWIEQRTGAPLSDEIARALSQGAT